MSEARPNFWIANGEYRIDVISRDPSAKGLSPAEAVARARSGSFEWTRACLDAWGRILRHGFDRPSELEQLASDCGVWWLADAPVRRFEAIEAIVGEHLDNLEQLVLEKLGKLLERNEGAVRSMLHGWSEEEPYGKIERELRATSAVAGGEARVLLEAWSDCEDARGALARRDFEGLAERLVYLVPVHEIGAVLNAAADRERKRQPRRGVMQPFRDFVDWLLDRWKQTTDDPPEAKALWERADRWAKEWPGGNVSAGLEKGRKVLSLARRGAEPRSIGFGTFRGYVSDAMRRLSQT